MSVEVKLPKTSESANESVIVFWHVSEGDKVGKGDVLVEVQTEKAVTEVPSPVDGIILEIAKKRSEVAAEGDILAIIETEDQKKVDVTAVDKDTEKGEKAPSNNTGTPDNEKGRPIKSSPRVKKLARELGVDLSTIVPTGPGGKVTVDDVQQAANPVMGEAPEEETHDSNNQLRAAPSVRKYAREHGVKLEEVTPSGPRKRVLREDITRFLKERNAGKVDEPETAEKISEFESQPQTTLETVSESEEKGIKQHEPESERERREPLTAIRQVISRAMVHSSQTIPHVTHFGEVDVTDLVRHRKKFKGIAEDKGIKLTFMAYAVKALTSTLKKYPVLNASIDVDRSEIVYKDYYHIGIAVDTDRGLFVPVIRDADKKSLLDIDAEINTYAEKARAGKLTTNDLSGGTCSISNIGSADGSWFTPIINHPEVAILGFGKIEKKPIVVDDNVVIAPMLALSLSYDHRIIDGVTAQSAMNHMKKLFHDPEFLLMDL